ncbi:MAG: type II toxin-antitoxin system RelE/ParE family toxin [Candidatus Omnitrophota bacterium]|nr:type II toxin-antitoxin system RelE/ParE family toxin [Candidatus Omnitrophota bacterium]
MEENRLSGIYYFIDERGDNLVRDFIESLPVKERAKVFAYISELKKQGNNLRRPMAGYLENGIYELRPRDNRIFYFFYLKGNAVLVHAINKRTREIPRNDLNLCLKRKGLIEAGYDHIERLGSRGDLDEES